MKDTTSSARVDEGRTDSKKYGPQNTTSSTTKNKAIENVIILQRGGTVGAFGCGVFKALAEKNMKINIVAGTSIGGVNAAIIAGSKNEGRPEQLLEEFWLELTDSFVDLENTHIRSISPQLEQMISNYYFYYTSSLGEKKNESLRKMKE
jgi:NTE family protein